MDFSSEKSLTGCGPRINFRDEQSSVKYLMIEKCDVFANAGRNCKTDCYEGLIVDIRESKKK